MNFVEFENLGEELREVEVAEVLIWADSTRI